MPEFFYDLHLHSCLSPCADDEMTPYNLVNMAKLCGQQIIALTDHNTAANCRAAWEVGKKVGLVVVPGMELCTAEEIHMLCLFAEVEQAEAFSAFIRKGLPPVANRPHIFGHQFKMDERDHVLGEEDLLLVTASAVSVDDLPALCTSYGGVCLPAHIDRSSYSILSVLGAFPPHLNFGWAEFSPAAVRKPFLQGFPLLQQTGLLCSSDAHRLADMPEAQHKLALEECTARCLVETLRRKPLESLDSPPKVW